MVVRCYFGRYSHVDIHFERGKVVDVFRGVITEKTRPEAYLDLEEAACAEKYTKKSGSASRKLLPK
jgi:hypothetical protein